MDAQKSSKVATIGRYNLMKKLGSGATSKVYLAYDTVNKNHVALKVLMTSDPKYLSTIKGEVELQSNLNHKNILQFNEFYESAVLSDAAAHTQTVTTIVLEYAAGGDILQLIDKLKVFPETLARTYFQQLIQGLAYMHKNEIAHRDVKPENITLDASYCVKLADFGCSASFSRKKLFKTPVGTSKYFPPEIHQGLPYEGVAYDLFATAMVAFCMTVGHMPFAKAVETDSMYGFFFKGKTKLFWRSHDAILGTKTPKIAMSADFQDIMTKMFDPSPKKRLTIEEIQSHPWYNGPTLTNSEIWSVVKSTKRV